MTVYFLVEPEKWREESRLDILSGIDPPLRTNRPSHHPPFSLAMSSLPRLRALELAYLMINNSTISHHLEDWAGEYGGRKVIITLMLNQGHLPLAKNAIYHLRRIGLLHMTVLYAMSDDVCQELMGWGGEEEVHCLVMPGIGDVCPHCGE